MFMNKTVHEQVTIFNTILMNIFSNYIPNKYIIIDDQDPPWMTKAIKENQFIKIFIQVKKIH